MRKKRTKGGFSMDNLSIKEIPAGTFLFRNFKNAEELQDKPNIPTVRNCSLNKCIDQKGEVLWLHREDVYNEKRSSTNYGKNKCMFKVLESLKVIYLDNNTLRNIGKQLISHDYDIACLLFKLQEYMSQQFARVKTANFSNYLVDAQSILFNLKNLNIVDYEHIVKPADYIQPHLEHAIFLFQKIVEDLKEKLQLVANVAEAQEIIEMVCNTLVPIGEHYTHIHEVSKSLLDTQTIYTKIYKSQSVGEISAILDDVRENIKHVNRSALNHRFLSETKFQKYADVLFRHAKRYVYNALPSLVNNDASDVKMYKKQTLKSINDIYQSRKALSTYTFFADQYYEPRSAFPFGAFLNAYFGSIVILPNVVPFIPNIRTPINLNHRDEFRSITKDDYVRVVSTIFDKYEIQRRSIYFIDDVWAKYLFKILPSDINGIESPKFSLAFPEEILLFRCGKSQLEEVVGASLVFGGHKQYYKYNNRKYVVRIGTRGGKYILVKQQKVYLSSSLPGS